MNSALIGKIEKARRYAAERGRVAFQEFTVTFKGDNDTHDVSYHDGAWRCGCEFFQGWGLCSHTMAMERMLRDMLPESAVAAFPPVARAS